MKDHSCAFGADRHRVLLIDDDPWMLKIMKVALAATAGVATCTSAEQALCLLEVEPFDVVCTDLVMPGMSGAELLGAVARTHPGAGRLLVTGAADRVAPEDRARHEVLLKPFDPERFAGLVERLASAARAAPRGVQSPSQLTAHGEHR